MRIHAFDIETAPLSESELALAKPTFQAPKNWSDPEKIKASIAEKEQAWRDGLALDALTCRVLAIGTTDRAHNPIMEGDEKEMLRQFWVWLDGELAMGHVVVGFAVYHFDLPVLVRRSYFHGLRIPILARRGRYWNENIVDLMDLWTLGNREQRVSLDTLAKFFGVGAKNGSGKDFAALYASDRDAALNYLHNDLELTLAVARRMGVIGEQPQQREEEQDPAWMREPVTTT